MLFPNNKITNDFLLLKLFDIIIFIYKDYKGFYFLSVKRLFSC